MTLRKRFKSFVIRLAKRFGIATYDDLAAHHETTSQAIRNAISLSQQAIHEVIAQSERAHADWHQQIELLREAIGRSECSHADWHQQIELLREAIGRSECSHADWHRQIASLTSAVVQKASISEVQSRLARFQDELDELRLNPVRSDALQVGGANAPKEESTSGLSEAFYRALERQFRGTEEEIRNRQQFYQPWFADLAGAPVADLGCGNGEWLALLQQWGVKAVGVDANGLNVESLRKSGRNVEHADVTDWLGRQPSSSYAAVTAFHLVEHLTARSLLALLEQVRRVLRPGGLLLLETPNPENIMVVTQTFWLDPTHIRPLPPALLQFMVEFSGFRSEQVIRLNPPDLTDPQIASQFGSFGDAAKVGRDYAVFAYRPGDQA